METCMPRFLFALLLAAGCLTTALPALAVIGHTPPTTPAERVRDNIRGTFALVVGGFVFVVTVVTGVSRVKRKATVNSILPKLVDHDPLWDTAAMITRVREVFARVQVAWSKRDMSLAADDMTPDCLLRYRARLEMREGRQIRNVVDRLRLLSVEIYHVKDFADDAGDQFRALVGFEAVDYDVNMATNMLAEGASTELRSIVQTWHFRRSGDAWLLDKIEDSDADVLLAPASWSETLDPQRPKPEELAMPFLDPPQP
jgi:hypothetical protein